MPGTGAQVHDNNGGIPPSGLFWTVALPEGAFTMDADRAHATLRAQDVPVIDQFFFLGPNMAPATVSLQVHWEAVQPPAHRGKGGGVPPTDPAAFLGEFALARSTASFAGSELGFGFRTDPGVSSDRGFAELGRERNGVFL